MMRRDARSAEASLGTLFHETEEAAALASEVAWYAARLPRSGAPILDAMAGSGALLAGLLEAGFPVHGAEASAARLALCRARLDARGQATQLFRQPASALNLPFRYAAAFVAGGAFQLLVDRTAALDALLRIRAHLVDPGLLLLELFVPSGADHPPGAAIVEIRTVIPIDGCRIGLRSETSFDADSKRIDVVRRYERRERRAITAREDQTISLTWYSEDDAAELLGAAGYLDIRVEAAPRTGEGGGHRFAVAARAGGARLRV
ncbi:MAG TPA: class I SAM-dependent methyltransferase [Casimicrobiaceae bacterium]|nr:class I SAM-dependent methyltransferase [Casimicrobiaceae bacterium]